MTMPLLHGNNCPLQIFNSNEIMIFSEKEKRANLNRTNLRDANLRSANLREADLTDAHLQGANLSHSDLTREKIDVKYKNIIDCSSVTGYDSIIWNNK
ncbi:MAG: pentapeptide repeat-containing protein [Lachnospiraceae bacterium]|nr:pentapeptide repeat-containing protein [Lachnospiraceae bacterium]